MSRPGPRRGAAFFAPLAVASGLGFFGCESAISRIDPASPRFAKLAPEEIAALRRGRADYIAKCSGCHGLYRPSHGGPDYWEKWVEAMAQRSRLTWFERERITGYLVALSGH